MKTTFKQYLLEAEGKMPRAESIDDLFDSIVNGKFTKDGSKLEVDTEFFLQQLNLTSLEGSPQKIEGDFICSGNSELTSLEGGPQEVDAFHCNQNIKLTLLIGCPQIVGSYFNCSDNKELTSIMGAPKHIYESFYCDHNPKLESLIGAPREVKGSFGCNSTGITSLIGAPQIIDGSLICSGNKKLTSLSKINFYIHEINGNDYGEEIYGIIPADFSGCPIKSNILGILKIRNLTSVKFDNSELTKIMNKYLPLGNISECMDELLDNNFEEFAKW